MASKKEERYARRRLRTSYITTIISMTLVLFMLGVLGLILMHAHTLSNQVKESIAFSIILKADVSDADGAMYQKTFDTLPFVKASVYIDKQQAAQELQKELGEDFIKFLGYNPLPQAIDVHLKADYANTDSLRKIERFIASSPLVSEVRYVKSLIQQLNDNIRKVTFILIGFSVILLLISIALINNTIRLAVFSKRFLIKSMQLIGATQGFIRRPFILKGIIQGLVSAILAIGLLIGIIQLGQREVPELLLLQTPNMFWILLAIVSTLGVLIAWLSNYFAVRKYLKIKTDSLYHF